MAQRFDDADVRQQAAVLGLDPLDDDGDPPRFQLLGDAAQRVRAGGVEHAQLGQPNDHHLRLGMGGIEDLGRNAFSGTEEHRTIEAQ